MTQAHVFYSGTVQGIGFRYTVEGLANDLGLKGWVRNLKDGRVELMVEGPQEAILQLFEKINRRFNGYIKDRNISYAAGEGSFEEFRIVF